MPNKIETLKKKLDNLVDKKGIDSCEVLDFSRKVDDAIVEYYKNSNENILRCNYKQTILHKN
ncbi:MAG: aspartyl-phosphate phosphatase Spo0E family protein [Bacillota bacterium]|nr:aspartyl-phosphate phosphatase Spo0E family protein [Bacillota bacterium]